MTTMNIEKEREAFEKMAAEAAPGHSLSRRVIDGKLGDYMEYPTACAFSGWLAARRSPSPVEVGEQQHTSGLSPLGAGTTTPVDLSATGLIKLWKQANEQATNTQPAPFQFARLLLATLPEAAAQERDSGDVALMVKRLRNMGLTTCDEAATMLEALAAKLVQRSVVPQIHDLISDWEYGFITADTALREIEKRHDAALATHTQPAHFDVERMKEALAQPSIQMPEGASREEVRSALVKGAQAEKKASGLVGWQNAIEELSGTTPTTAADGDTSTTSTRSSDMSKSSVKIDTSSQAVAPLASSADTIDGPEFRRLVEGCVLELNGTLMATGIRFQKLRAHIDARIAEARQRGWGMGYDAAKTETPVSKLLATPAAAAPKAVELPPLPEGYKAYEYTATSIVFGAEQMQSYARAAVALAAKGE